MSTKIVCIVFCSIFVFLAAWSLPGAGVNTVLAQESIAVEDTHLENTDNYGTFIQGECSGLIEAGDLDVSESEICTALLYSYRACEYDSILQIDISYFEEAQPFLTFLDGASTIAEGELWSTEREATSDPYMLAQDMDEVFVRTQGEDYIFVLGNDTLLGDTGEVSYIIPRVFVFSTDAYSECVTDWLSRYTEDLSEISADELFVDQQQGF